MKIKKVSDLRGYPDPMICPNCGQFRKRTEACKRCGCAYGVVNYERT